MRWPDWLILITSGALIWGAVSAFSRSGIILSQAGADGSYHDTYYVVANGQYPIVVAAGIALVAALYLTLIRPAGPGLAATAALSIAAAALGYTLMMRPQAFAGRAAMPRRYTDYPDAFALWSKIATFGGILLLLATARFVVATLLALLARYRR